MLNALCCYCCCCNTYLYTMGQRWRPFSNVVVEANVTWLTWKARDRARVHPPSWLPFVATRHLSQCTHRSNAYKYTNVRPMKCTNLHSILQLRLNSYFGFDRPMMIRNEAIYSYVSMRACFPIYANVIRSMRHQRP